MKSAHHVSPCTTRRPLLTDWRLGFDPGKVRQISQLLSVNITTLPSVRDRQRSELVRANDDRETLDFRPTTLQRLIDTVLDAGPDRI